MLSLLLALAQPVFAQTPSYAEDSTEEIIVWGDLFARWDDTRWMITTELGLPVPLTLTKDEVDEFQASLLQIRAIFNCSKEWKLSRKKFEVNCEIEDFGMKAAMDHRRLKPSRIAKAQGVLDEIDAKLTGAAVQLQVAADGRVLNVDLEGLPRQNRRQSAAQETLRVVLGRLIAGYNLKMQRFNQLHEGKWIEYNSSLMSLPVEGRALGSNMLVHYLNRYKGHVLVQSIGKGSTQLTYERAQVPGQRGGVSQQVMTYDLDLIGVSIFDDQEGFMTERVWAVNGKTTGSTYFQDRYYFHAGRVTLLGAKDRPSCGPSTVVNGPKQSHPDLDKWVPIERPG